MTFPLMRLPFRCKIISIFDCLHSLEIIKVALWFTVKTILSSSIAKSNLGNLMLLSMGKSGKFSSMFNRILSIFLMPKETQLASNSNQITENKPVKMKEGLKKQ